MEFDKLVYEVIEDVSAISDDRYVDRRLIEHKINSVRADLLRKLLARKPGYSTIGLTQNIRVEVAAASRTIVPSVPLGCYVLRSTAPVPKLIYEHALSTFYTVSTIDVLKNTIEVIDYSRAHFAVFEFPVVYAFLGPDYHLYFMSPDNNMELKNAVLNGIFESPTEAESGLTDYPLNLSEWSTIKPLIVADILNRPQDDPKNNSEPDLGTVQKGVAPSK